MSSGSTTRDIASLRGSRSHAITSFDDPDQQLRGYLHIPFAPHDAFGHGSPVLLDMVALAQRQMCFGNFVAFTLN